jgi:hypothetical protein
VGCRGADEGEVMMLFGVRRLCCSRQLAPHDFTNMVVMRMERLSYDFTLLTRINSATTYFYDLMNENSTLAKQAQLLRY